MKIEIGDLLPKIQSLPADKQMEIMDLLSKASEKRQIEECRDHFLPFVRRMWPIFIPGSHHTKMAKAFERVAEGKLKRLIICMPPRHKLSVDTPVATTEGWKTMGTLKVGDFVFDPDGLPVQVVGKSDVYEKQIYEVETDDGHVIETDDDHLWAVRFKNGPLEPFRKLSSKQIMQRMSDPKKGINNTPKIPVHRAAQYPERDLIVPPYVLGAWLGDGVSNDGSMACDPKDEAHMRRMFEDRGIQTTDVKADCRFGTRGLRVKLREIGVLHNKHIPEIYLTASVEQRMELLRGLIDTDGSVGKCGKATFHATPRHLAEQVLELVNSLGCKARITERQTSYRGKPSKRSYRVQFKLAGCATLPRKASRSRDVVVRNPRVLTIRKTDRTGRVLCIEVASRDGLFLAGRGYVVTSNTKSEFGSWLLPAWFLGKYPDKKIIQASNTADLAVGFGRKVRDLIEEQRYQEVFPGTGLKADNKAAGQWTTTAGGVYVARGVGGAVTGKGADLLIIDDPHSEQEARQAEYNSEVFDGVYEWFTSGPRQRLQPGGAIVVIMTRWSKKDLVGRILKRAAETGEEWEVIEFPAILPSGNPLWPEFWPLEQLEALKKELPLPKWMSQYQQSPTSDAAAIVKREWWRPWERDKLPPFDAILQSWDTAFTTTERSNHSACTTWGIFEHPDANGREQAHIMLIDAFKEKLEFPELKQAAKALYHEYQPDICIIEAKAAGGPLIYELRAAGIPVSEFTPTRGNDKIARLNGVSDIFASGRVWYEPSHEAEMVIEEVASFPNGEDDDLVDTTSQALIRFRQGGWVTTDADEVDDDDAIYLKRRKKAYY